MDMLEFNLEYDKASLEARVRCEALISRLQYSFLEPAGHNHGWIQHGRSLRVEVHYRIDGRPLAVLFQDNAVVAKLQVALRTARLWGQLGLETSDLGGWTRPHVGDGTFSTDRPQMSVYLQPIHKTAAQGRPAARLLNGMPFKDTKPPACIEAGIMQGIKLYIDVYRKMEFTALPGSEKGPCINEPDEEMLDDTTFCVDDFDSHAGLPMPQIFSSPCEQQSPVVAKLLKEQLSIDVLAGLLDAAVRGSIYREPTRLMAGLKTTPSSTKERSSLSELAPMVWSPNCLPTIAERACYVTTLGSTLAGYLQRSRTAKSRTLREKLLGMSGDSVRTAQQTCEILLWNEMRGALSKDKSARSLKPIQLGPERQCAEEADEDKMLFDELAGDWQHGNDRGWTDATILECPKETNGENELLWQRDDFFPESQDSGYGSATFTHAPCGQETSFVYDVGDEMDTATDMYVR